MSIEIGNTDIDDFLVDPGQSLKEKLQYVIESSSILDVVTEEQFKRMTRIYSEAKEWEKRIEFIRKQANQPDQERINARNDAAKDILAPLKQIQSIAKQKCEGYQSVLEARKTAEEKKIQDAVDLLGLDEAPLPVPVEKTVRGSGALMYTKVVRKFRTTDISKVPLKYLKIDEESIERDIKLGVGEIPGIEIYEEKQTTLRTR